MKADKSKFRNVGLSPLDYYTWGLQSFSDAAVLLVDLQLAPWALDGVVASTLAADST